MKKQEPIVEGKPDEEFVVQVHSNPAEHPEHPKLIVVEGKSLITKRGIRGPGDDITAKELPGGIKQLHSLYEKKFIKEPEEEDQG